MTDPRAPSFVSPAAVQRPSGLWVPTEQPPGAGLAEVPEGTLLVVGEPASDLDTIWAAPRA